MKITKKEYLAKGKRGVVHTVMYDGKKVVLKSLNPTAHVDTIAHEAAVLQKVNEKGIGPKFITLTKEGLLLEYVDGPEILVWASGANIDELKTVLLDLLQQCRTMDEMGISKREMTRPYKHILMQGDKPVQIDFERSLDTEKPKNVTQYCQWLTNSRMSELLEKKEMRISKEQLMECAKQYKRTYAKKEYAVLRKVVEDA